VRAYLALGANLGDRLAALAEAVRRLSAASQVAIESTSRVYESDPVGPAQTDYLNAVIGVETGRSARGLLEAALDVERSMGRVRGERWGPRTIDIDVLSYGRSSIEELDLVVPHPRMHERGFVLVPLLELDPDPVLPGGRSAGAIRPVGPGWSGRVRLFSAALPIP
jgi:2-amino-4-hydroxy-6-hydroxymethyldihydropteridine diphosphokinase